MRLVLYQPDIPQNTGTILRMAACLAIPVDIIGPAGFDLSDRALRRAGLDYLDHAEMVRHVSFEEYEQKRAEDLAGRLVLVTTQGQTAYTDFHFSPKDSLMLGRESAGVPENIHRCADARLHIPMRKGMRSLNIAVAAAMVLGEALRQTQLFPGEAQ